jgi:hypothetical protein
MTPLELNNQFGVAILAAIASLVIRRVNLSERIQSLVPSILCISIFWLFVNLPTASNTIVHGMVSGLLASGLLICDSRMDGKIIKTGRLFQGRPAFWSLWVVLLWPFFQKHIEGANRIVQVCRILCVQRGCKNGNLVELARKFVVVEAGRHI